ncbi:MAG: glucoamylase family protein [Candidatus Izemoplasmatales bacterium]|nr:glucoamylase family protein [Candidatus Izemoplasmatales bacterium]
MKKTIGIFVLALLVFALSACNVDSTTTTTTTTTTDTTTTTETGYVYNPITVADYVLEEERLSFKFFWEVVNGDPTSAGYGMVSDRYNTATKTYGAASIASVGFGLAALPIGIENGWLSYQEAYERALGTMHTIENMQRTHGFFYHFVSMASSNRDGSSEVSIIDTAIMLCGMLTAGQYFGGEIQTIAEQVYQEVEWTWYYNDVRNQFYMGYTPESGFGGYWDSYAEQLMIYLLAAASDNYAVGKEAYDKMKAGSQRKSYGSSDFYYASYPGTLFTYQYSHAFFDFRTAFDQENINWFNNSVAASVAAYDYADLFLKNNYLTYVGGGWGNTASDGPDGYRAYGNLAAAGTIYIDGTLAPSGAIGSLPFVPDKAMEAFAYYESLEALQGKYGYLDSFNLGLTETASTSIIRPNRVIPVDGWFDTDVIGIDKGIEMVMIENYRSSLIWDIFMQNEIVQKGFEELGFTILS